MQNKGVVKFFAITFVLVCLFQLSFTLVSYIFSNKADKYANDPKVTVMSQKMSKGDPLRKEFLYDSISKRRLEYFNDSMGNVPVYNILIKKYTLKDVREREINLGLDLKGGMNVTMEVSVPDIIRALSGYSQNPTFNKALADGIEQEKKSTSDFVSLFYESFKKIDPNAKLASIFNTVELKDKINYNTTNDEVIKVIRDESNAAIDRTFNILRTRIDRFGVTQPNIQKLQTAGRILIELPGIKDPERVRKLLQGTAQLEFWETYQYPALHSYFAEANKKLVAILSANEDSAKITAGLNKDTTGLKNAIENKSLLAEKKEPAKTEVAEPAASKEEAKPATKNASKHATKEAAKPTEKKDVPQPKK